MPTPEEKILSQLQGAPRINPASARLFTDWTLEPGDVVTVRSTEGDSVRNYQLPIYSMDFNWNGSPMMEISSSGNPEREPLPELVRKEYAEATSSRGMGRRIADVEEEVQQQYQTWQTKTDKLIGDYAKITGVKLDAEGNVVYADEDQTIPVFDPTSPYSLYAKHEVTAQNIVDYVGLTGIKFGPDGKPIYKQATDAQGNPVWETDEQGNYVLDDEGNRIPVPATDSQGNLIPDLEADGHSMYSQISQSLDEIDIKVQGKASSAEVRTLADQVGLFITNGQIDAAAIFLALNGDNTTTAYIKADKIQLDGTAVISAIEGAKAPDGQTRLKISADSLDFGGFAVNRTKIASGENAYNLVAHNITTTGEIWTKKFTFETLFDGDNESPIVSAKLRTGYDSSSTMTEKEKGTLRLYIRGSVNASGQISGPSNVDLYATDFPHYHTVTFDNATGQITIGGITATAPAPFDLTRTTWYQNQISAERAAGRGEVFLSNAVYGEVTEQNGQYYLPFTYSLVYSNPTEQEPNATTIVQSNLTAYPTGFNAIRNAIFSDGQNSVNVSGPTWSAVDSSNPYTRTATFKPSIGTGSTADLVLSGTWSYAGNAISASAVYSVSDTTDPDPTKHIKLFSTTASLLKDYNQNNANNVLVYLTDGGQNRWAQTTINITPGTISIPDPTSTYNDGKYTISATGAFTVDNNSYSMTAGSYTLTATDAINAGKDSVTLGEFTWSEYTQQNPSLPPNRTVSINVLGRATAINPKRLNLYLTNSGNWSPEHKQAVYLRAGNASGTQFAAVTLDATSEYTTGTTDGFTVCKNSVELNYTANQTVQPGSSITVYPVVRSSYSDSSTVNLTAKSITISAAASTYLDQWLYGTGGNDEEANTGAFYRVYANDYQHPVKGTQVQLTHSQAGTTRLVDYANTTKVLAKIDNPKVSGIVTSGYQKIILAASDTGANVSKEVRVTYTDGLGEDRNIIIDASAVYEAGQDSTALTGPTWNDYSGNTLPANRTATYKSGDTTAATLRLYLTTESTWTNHIKPVYLRPGSTSANAVARIDIDASGEYSAGQNSVEISTATLSNVVYNSSARSATAVLTVSLTNGKSKTYSDRVDVSTPYQAGLDGRSAVNTQSFRIKLTDYSGFEIDKTYAVNTKAIYDKGVEDATPVFEPVARYVWAESNDGAIKFYKNSTGSTRWGTLEANTRVWLMQENAVNGRYYVKFESYNSGSGSFSEYLGYIPTQFVHDEMKSGLYPGGGWKEAPDEETTMYIYDTGGNYVTVYSSNSINSSVIGQLYPNTVVTCLSVSNDWAQIRVVSNGSSVKCYVQYSIHLQSTENSPSKYGSARGWVNTPQAITITEYQIQEIRHSSGIYSSPLNVKMSNIRDNSMREYTSTATQSTTYENIATSGDPGDFLNLVNTSSGLKYYAWHNSTTYSGDVGHKVKMAVSYSDGNTETVWISILSKATNNYNYIN